MNPEIQDLARRAVACKHWRWMLRMRAVDGAERFRVSVVSHGYPQGFDEQPPMKVNVDFGLRWLPDLTDPATLGCLLALVREVRNDAGFHALLLPANENPIGSPEGSRWWVLRGVYTSYSGYAWASEAEALVAALEAAP